jgi:hypothetical protein
MLEKLFYDQYFLCNNYIIDEVVINYYFIRQVLILIGNELFI